MIATLDKDEIIEIHDSIVKESGEEIPILSEYKLDDISSRHKSLYVVRTT